MSLNYYRNRSGLVAVSYDDGDTVVVPTGRVLEVTEAWTDVEDDCHAELTPEQLRILERMVPLQRTDELGGIISRFSRNRRAVERRDGTGATDNYRIRPIPENAGVVVSAFKEPRD